MTLLLAAIVTRLDTVGSSRVLTAGHALSSAAAGFARGLNEGSKIASLGVLLLAAAGRGSIGSAPFWLFALIAVVMAAGSYISGERVTKTLAEKVTDMDHAEALSANLVTAVLVAVASNLGLPVSNAEVGSGAITGSGIYERARSVNWGGLVRNMAAAWIITAPAAGLLGLAAFKVLRLLPGAV